MGREVRKVPANWQHPKNDDGHFIPLMGGSYSKRLADWEEGQRKWAEGLRFDYSKPGQWIAKEPAYCVEGYSYADWDGDRPCHRDYMPDWPESERTHLMMYEDTSEGTPISPAFLTPEELARWLADTNASAFAGQGASYEAWLATITSKSGSAPSAMFSPQTGMISGVEAMLEKQAVPQ